jgi:peptidoglycan/LPS O-acetylase OafA/YrhL
VNFSYADALLRGHRKDIDGLRAIAVLGVVLFHIDPALVPGGFVGVDIFFVISGFLITSIIRREVSAGTFTYAGFYARRVKRIFPALAVAVAVTVIAGHFILLPPHLDELARSAVASVLFTANFFFAFSVDTGYFAEDSATKPLLHIWSLGVEEQFYFVWPLALVSLMAVKTGNQIRLVIILAVAIASLALSEWLARTQPTVAYYMLPSRAFEMLIGASIAFLPLVTSRTVAQSAAAAGLVLIALSMAFLNETSIFPGINALPSTIGAGLLIFAANIHRPLASRLLSIAPMRWIGFISYSLYLWHWPVMAYIRYAYVEVTPLVGLLAFAAMIGLSVLSYRFVELPFIKSKAPENRVFLCQLVAPIAAISAFCLVFIWSNGYGLYDTPEYRTEVRRAVRNTRPANRFPYICQEWQITEAALSNPDCLLNPKAKKSGERILLWGDSNAIHYVGVIAQIAKRKDFSFRNIAAAACPPVFNLPARQAARCTASNEVMRTALSRYDVVLIGANWANYQRAWGEAFLVELSATLQSLQGKRVILLGQIPQMRSFDTYCEAKKVKLPFLDCENLFSYAYAPDENIADDTNRRLMEIAKQHRNVELFTINDLICRDGICSPYLNGRPTYYNGGHLSLAGSFQIGQLMIRKRGIPPQFSGL